MYLKKSTFFFVQHIKGVVCLWLGRHVGLPRQRPDAEEVPVHHDEERGREGRSEEEVEVAANPAEQGGEGDHLFKWRPDVNTCGAFLATLELRRECMTTQKCVYITKKCFFTPA